MTLDTVIMLFGALVALLPFLQFPTNWQSAIAFIAGIVIVGLGIIVRRRRGTWESAMREQERFTDQKRGEPGSPQV